MPNPKNEPSRSPYIIICNGRIGVAAAADPIGKVQAASQAATALVMYYGITANNKLKSSDTQAISELQHEMMINLASYSLADAEAVANQMLELLDELEDKLQG